MQEILKKLNELIGVCESRVKKVEQERTELAALRGNLNAQKDTQESREKDVQSQEAALAKKKLIVKTIEEARQMFQESSEEKKQLKVKRDELEIKIAEHTKKMAEEAADIQRQKDKAVAMVAETEKKASLYKVEVMKEILKNSENLTNEILVSSMSKK